MTLSEQGETQAGDRTAAHNHSQQKLLLGSGHSDHIRRRQHHRQAIFPSSALSARIYFPTEQVTLLLMQKCIYTWAAFQAPETSLVSSSIKLHDCLESRRTLDIAQQNVMRKRAGNAVGGTDDCTLTKC